MNQLVLVPPFALTETFDWFIGVQPPKNRSWSSCRNSTMFGCLPLGGLGLIGAGVGPAGPGVGFLGLGVGGVGAIGCLEPDTRVALVPCLPWGWGVSVMRQLPVPLLVWKSVLCHVHASHLASAAQMAQQSSLVFWLVIA